jgi:predicted RNase H-like HicB family nuclease
MRRCASQIGLTAPAGAILMAGMKQRYHAIIKPCQSGWVGWVEEIPGTITSGRTLQECREHLREALQLILATYRDEARQALDSSCRQETLEVEVDELEPAGSH